MKEQKLRKHQITCSPAHKTIVLMIMLPANRELDTMFGDAKIIILSQDAIM
jgi:hypothetical protein